MIPLDIEQLRYSHKDEVWKDRLVTHLGVLQQGGLLDLWDDRRIGAGGNWYQKIEDAVARASVAVLLVSADFLTSKFILSKEIPDLLERRDKEGLRIFPVIIKPCAWKHVKWLARMNLRPKDGKPISSGDEHQIDADMAAIADEVAAIIESKTPITPLETSPTTAPEKISIPQLQSTNSNLSGHEMRPKTMCKITILHLSDIHFKRNKDDKNKTYRKDVKNKMVAEIKQHIDRNNLGLDFVAVTGDIAFSGKEYAEAKNFFDDLKSILPEKTVFLAVPGNHDVDRDEVLNIFSLHHIVKKQQTDALLENEKAIKSNINVKFESFRQFVQELNPDLYRSEDDYFWVRNFEDKNVSFLGLNSAWASENDDDRNNITLGYPQVMKALDMSTISNKIVLMHHPFDWFYEQDFDKSHVELSKNCGLMLHGHIHADKAFVFRDPTNSYICLGANASYTDNRNGRIGFQFVRVEFQKKGVAVRVWPYILNDRRNEFVPDRERWKVQEGKEYFDLNTFESTGPQIEPPQKIPPKYKDWVREFYSTISYDQLAKKGEVLPVQLLEVYIPLETANPFHKAEMERMSKDHEEKSRLEQKDELEGEADLKEPATIDIEALLGRVNCILLRGKAGMGKTTLIKHLANTITEDSCQSSLRDYLPVMVFLKDFWLVYNEELKKKSRRKITFDPLLKAYLKKSNAPSVGRLYLISFTITRPCSCLMVWTRSRRKFAMTLSKSSLIFNSRTKVTAF